MRSKKWWIRLNKRKLKKNNESFINLNQLVFIYIFLIKFVQVFFSFKNINYFPWLASLLPQSFILKLVPVFLNASQAFEWTAQNFFPQSKVLFPLHGQFMSFAGLFSVILNLNEYLSIEWQPFMQISSGWRAYDLIEHFLFFAWNLSTFHVLFQTKAIPCMF